MFGPEDFDRLAEQLAGIEGKFLMSINDVPEVRAHFRGFDIGEIVTSYTIGKQTRSRKPRRELLVSNKQ
jgi:DNA adenine methylase